MGVFLRNVRLPQPVYRSGIGKLMEDTGSRLCVLEDTEQYVCNLAGLENKRTLNLGFVSWVF